MRVFAGTDIGKAREMNQDYYYVSRNSDEVKLCVLADGMGGYTGGEVASNLAVISVKNYIYNNYAKIKLETDEIINLLKDATQYANMIVYEKTREISVLEEMGTTLEVVLMVENKIYISHIGDSRIYKIRNGKIKQLTKDHSYVEKLINEGKISKEEAINHPKKNIITKALGCTAFVEPDVIQKKMEKKDIIVMTSDGLTNKLTDKQIYEIIEKDIETSVRNLINEANELGGNDNITTIIVHNN